MLKISEIDLGSALLSIFILIGFIATAFALIRICIISINYTKANFPKTAVKEKKDQINKKGF